MSPATEYLDEGMRGRVGPSRVLTRLIAVAVERYERLDGRQPPAGA